MPESQPSQRHRKRRSRGRVKEERLSYRGATLYRRHLRVVVLPAFIFLVIIAGGGMPLWAQAGVLIVGGIWGLRNPPKASPDRNFDWAVIGLLFAACLALLPAFLTGGRPAWWNNAVDLGIMLPFTTTPQPFQAIEGLVMLLGGLLWFYLIWHWKLEGEDHRRMLWFFSHGVMFLALAVAIGTYHEVTYPLGKGASVFSFFDNRNQMATVLVMGGLVSFALAMQGMRKARMKGIWGLLNTLVIFTGLAFCESRAGIILFCLGCLLWFVFRLRVSKVNMMFKVGVPIFIMCLTLLFIFGQRTLERFSLWTEQDVQGIVELRVGIYQDTLDMASKHALTGVGLGSYDAVFPQFRDHSAVFQSIIHPESDWMWVLSETGVLGVFFMTAGMLFLLARLFPFGVDRTAPFRAAAAVAFFIFLIHSLFDVPGHRLGTLLVAMMLYRLAAPYRTRQKLPVFGPRWWRVVAVISLAGGVVWMAASLFNLPLQTDVIGRQAKEAIAREAEEQTREADRLLRLLDRAIANEPLNWWFYSTRANVRLGLKRDNKGALDDFRRARFLEKTDSEVSFFEGHSWLNYSNQRAFAAWRDAINRKDPNKEDLYRKMLETALPYPRFQKDLKQLTRFDPDFRFYYLMQANAADFGEEIETDVIASPKLAGFSEVQKAALLEKWAEKGDPLALLDHFNDYPGIIDNEWFYRAIAYANNEDYDIAVQAISTRIVPMKIPLFRQYVGVTEEEHQRLFNSTPDDILRGSALLDMQMRNGDFNSAIRTAETMMKQKEVPPYVYYWKGELHRKLGESMAAWEAWQQYYKMTHDMEMAQDYVTGADEEKE